MRKQWPWWLFSILVLVILLYPEKLTVVPAYHVKLVDQFGKPMADTAVSELWQQASAERSEHLEQIMTDAQGETDLPQRTLRAPLAERLLGCFAYHSREGMESPCGNHYTIGAAGDLKELDRSETISGILKRKHSLTITVKRCDINEPALC
ncbi:hypothetical protein [Acidobacterium sp. S8]|uniref:hypothetical protein n=1 Tax=Acidobacterium sp. S8 TaxID=1641854 RepID=UPI00131E6AE8|nr:hypothetical protein [Acidobacterium sp. S8]